MKSKLISGFVRSVPFLALALLVLLVLGQANPYTTLPTRDSGCYLYVGRLILRGEVPYINAWDSKPPAIFYINALGLFIGRGTRWGVWLLEFLFLYSAAIIGYRLLRKVWEPGAAVFGMIIWVWGLDWVFWKGNLVEEYPMLFSMAALSFFWLGIRNPRKRWYDLLIGVMTVLSFLFRANNIGMGIAIVTAWVIIGMVQKQFALMMKRLGMMLAGCGLAFLCTAIFLWHEGILVAAWNAAILYNFSYIGNHAKLSSSIFPGFSYLGMVAWIALLGYGAAVFSIFRMLRTKTFDPFIIILIVLWPIEIVLSALSGRGYMHYFVNWLPAVALLSGYLYHLAAPVLLSYKSISFLNTEKIPLTIAVLFAMVLGYGRVVDYSHTLKAVLFDRKYGVEDIDLVSLYIRRNTKPSDKVLDWGNSGINYMSQRDAPTAYLWYPEYLPSRITPQLVDGFYQDITSHPPEIIVDAYLVAPDDVLSINPAIRQQQIDDKKGLFVGRASNVNQVFAFIQSHYKVEKVIEGNVIYRLIKP
ncbi:MAG: glycosyltransferase family 39 protein [Anaerolineales bacterium]